MSNGRFLVRYRRRANGNVSSTGLKPTTPPALAEIPLASVGVSVTSGTPVVRLSGDRGVIIGQVFRKGERQQVVAELDEAETDRILATDGERLCSDYWGAYCAFLTHPAKDQFWVVRDPAGLLPCYKIEHGDEILLASDIDLLAIAGGVNIAVAWRNLARFLYAPTLRRVETCIEGLFELRPGFATALHDRSELERVLWNPWDHALPREPQAVAEELEAIVRQAVAALSTSYDRVLVAASGGLDSSIVAAALKMEGRQFDCFTMATAEPSGDERPYARLVADYLGVGLIDRIYDPGRVDLLISSAEHLPRPVGKYFMQEMRRGLAEAAAETGATAVLTGNGGDNVFCYLHSARPILDRIRGGGHVRDLWQTSRDMCRITGADIFTMARLVARDLMKPVRSYHWTGDDTLLAGSVGPEVFEGALDPHLEGQFAGPMGKAQHIAMLMRIRHYVEDDRRPHAIPVIAPLISQPVIEFCLGVPTWEWATGGINRSLAREAFAGDLPAPVIRRTAKAGPDSFTAQLFSRNRAPIRSMLLDGLLASNAMLDRRAVEAALADPDIVRSQGHHRILMLCEAEAWCRSIHGGRTAHL